MDKFNYKRRETSEVNIGGIILGGNYPIRVQSMTNTSTNDTDLSVEQCIAIADAGGEYVRLTAQGVREADNLLNIKNALRKRGYNIPLIADIHFNPRAAEAAAKVVEKVRINPGNFVDKVKTFATFDYTDEEYALEIKKIKEKLKPLLDICKERKCALRLGINHGSLSDRIMSRFGDTPKGMVESCMEFLKICVDNDFYDVVISMKTSNTIVMNEAVRLLIDEMDKQNWHFPLHLGVTEAGDGEDGRIKSAVGIGALLSLGIGDTIRVSLSEDPQFEIPVAKKLVEYISQKEGHPFIEGEEVLSYSPFTNGRRETYSIENIGGDNLPIVISEEVETKITAQAEPAPKSNSFTPDYILLRDGKTDSLLPNQKGIIEWSKWNNALNLYPLGDIASFNHLMNLSADLKFLELDYNHLYPEVLSELKSRKDIVIILSTNHQNGAGEQMAFMHKLLLHGVKTPVVLKRSYRENDIEDLQIKASVDFGTLLLEGFGNGVYLQNDGSIYEDEIVRISFGILQASRLRTTKTEYISCPGCGRTLFDLQATVAKVKEATSHLKHLKIGVMGCIVNGPGEMADADYGYVGAEKGKISLYKKKDCIKKNISAKDAVDELITLIKENGDWVEPDKE